MNLRENQTPALIGAPSHTRWGSGGFAFLHQLADHVGGSVQGNPARVQYQMIMGRAVVVFPPEFPVKVDPAPVFVIDRIDGVPGEKLIFFFDKSYPEFLIGYEQDMKRMRGILEDELAAATQDDRLVFGGDFPNDLFQQVNVDLFVYVAVSFVQDSIDKTPGYQAGDKPLDFTIGRTLWPCRPPAG